MIKLYNYDKETLKFRRILERENMPDKYEFCTLTEIPVYDTETQYLEFDKVNDNWIIKDIEKPVVNLEILKEQETNKIKQELKTLDIKTLRKLEELYLFDDDITKQKNELRIKYQNIIKSKNIKEFNKIKGE